MGRERKLAVYNEQRHSPINTFCLSFLISNTLPFVLQFTASKVLWRSGQGLTAFELGLSTVYGHMIIVTV